MVPEFEIIERDGKYIIVWNTHDGNDPVKEELCYCDKKDVAERIIKALYMVNNVENFILYIQSYQP